MLSSGMVAALTGLKTCNEVDAFAKSKIAMVDTVDVEDCNTWIDVLKKLC